MDPPLLRETPDQTWFDARWEKLIAAPRFKVRFGYHRQFPEAAHDQFTIAELPMPELKKLLLEAFSWGVVHQAAATQQLELQAMAEKEAQEELRCLRPKG